MDKTRQTVMAPEAPLDSNVIWIDISSDEPIQKVFLNGEWKATSDPSIDAYTKEESDERFLENATNEGSMSQVLKIGNDNKPVWANVPGATAPDDRMSDASENAVQNKAIKKYIDSNFARQDGWYDTLVSGAAKNLVGHGTTPAEYTFRTSDGNADIGTGTATIDVMKGKTLKWQQMVKNGDYSQGTTNVVTFRCSVSVNDGVATYTYTTLNQSFGREIISSTIQGHKYYVSGILNVPAATNVRIISNYTVLADFGDSSVSVGVYKKYSRIITAPSTASIQFCIISAEGATSYTSEGEMCIDLTDLFGAGNEPSTVAEFEALYPLDYYAYTATPVLINNAASGIVTTGFNQWDEQWEVGAYNSVNGAKAASNDRIRSANKIKVIQGATYYFKSPANFQLYFYDENGVFLAYGTQSANTTRTFNSSAIHYFTFNLVANSGTTYNHDICINLSWSGYRNGEYEPYEKHTLYFDTIEQEQGGLDTIKGRLLDAQGEPTGDSVTIFPDGMKSAGSVYDFGKADSDGYIRKVTKRIGSVDMGNLNWAYNDSNYTFNVKFTSGKKTTNNICSKYTTTTAPYSSMPDKSIKTGDSGWSTSNFILVKDSAYTDADTFKTAMSGVPLYYELATPEEYLLDTPIPANYLVNDFGTEQRIPVDTASNVMAPILYDVKYAMNASDQLRRMRVNFVSATGIDNSTPSTLDNLLTCLGTALNGTFTKSSYDNENENYTFTFTPNETPGE